MHIAVEVIFFLLQFIYYQIEAIILAFIPSSFRKKSVGGQRVLVTGAGSGLGKLMSLKFAQLGCTVVLWDINKVANELTKEEIEMYGAKAHAYTCDLSKREDIYSVADKVKKEVGEIDILVNNAGIVTGKKFLDSPDALIDKSMQVNTMAHFWTVKAFLPSMMRRNKGHVVSIASVAGLFGAPGLCDYCCSKFGAVGFDEALATELQKMGKDGVHTTVVCPYYINTGMFDGAVTKFPKILPILDPEDTVNKIMDAVLTNQRMLCLPKIMYILYALRGLLPAKVADLCNDFFGATSMMDNFRGREKKD